MNAPYSRIKKAAFIALALIAACGLCIAAGEPEVPVGPFSSAATGGVPAGWKPWILKNVSRRTTYRLVKDDVIALRAVAEASASGLEHDIKIDPKEYPLLEWRWKVAEIIEDADISKKERNDAPARVYVAFSYDINKVGFFERLKYAAAKRIYSDSLPLRALCYTWANRSEKGSFVPMPYTSWFMQVVVENKGSPIREWLTEERDVYRDYVQAFHEEPGHITGVAIMTNTDNLHRKRNGWYGDIVFKKGGPG